jgi:hypothetical protein
MSQKGCRYGHALSLASQALLLTTIIGALEQKVGRYCKAPALIIVEYRCSQIAGERYGG